MMGASGIQGGACNNTVQLNPTEFINTTNAFYASAIAFGNFFDQVGNYGQVGTMAPVPVVSGDVLYLITTWTCKMLNAALPNYAKMSFQLEEY